MTVYPDRRAAIAIASRWLAGAVAGIGAGSQAARLVQSADRLPFGIRLPPAVEALVPGAPMEAARVIAQLLALEREAAQLRLPQSAISLDAILALPLDADALYALALPRLVTLIDRAERRNVPLADRAGALLARLHADEHRIPDGLAISPVGAANIKRARRRMALVQDAAASTGITPPVDVAPPPLPDPPEVAVPDSPQRSIRFADLRDEYRALFRTAQLRPDREAMAQWHGAALRRARPRYEAVSAAVGVPWYFIGTIHALEASFNFRAHLHNGDFPLSARTRQVPAGRPLRWLPPSDWESSASDAMRLMGFAGQSDWTLERTLHRLEAYNGFGYRRLGVPTPYLWSFSDHYDRGKFVADGRFSATARSQQCGAAVMLKLLTEQDGVDAGG